jgi:hypothetical protein
MEDNSNNGLLTKIWGPSAWNMLQCCAFGYPINPTDEDKKNFRTFYDVIKYVLPCRFCRESYTQFIIDDDTVLNDAALESRNTLVRWVYNIHEKVNKKLGVTYGLTFEDYVKRYESFRAKCVKDKIVNGCNMPLKDRTNAFKMAYNKDCHLIDCEIAKKFVYYAKLRGFRKKDFEFMELYSNIDKQKVNLYSDNLCDIWFKRNLRCERVKQKMRTHDIEPLEKFGKWEGMPGIDELKLILNLTSTLDVVDLIRVAQVIPHKKQDFTTLEASQENRHTRPRYILKKVN